jgi:hypothetical protein
MKFVACWNDLEPIGIVPLTGEACGLCYRLLFDLTARGLKIVAACFGIPDFKGAEPWNRGPADDPHVGSIMLSSEMLVPVAVFALLETGCTEAWLVGQAVVGIEAADGELDVQLLRGFHEKEFRRRFAYQGTAGSRNRHEMSGRVA